VELVELKPAVGGEHVTRVVPVHRHDVLWPRIHAELRREEILENQVVAELRDGGESAESAAKVGAVFE
jgi:hypothetical protein